jgi:hypothetical protein
MLVRASSRRVVRRRAGENSAEIGGIAWVLQAWCHSAGSGNGPADPNRDERREHADEEDPLGLEAREPVGREGSENHADM